jgi:tRNA threonylcarbamoyladenosine modification (KEOPS) complex  Pcc1 subunit
MITATLRADDDGTIAASLRPEAGRPLPRTRTSVEETDGTTVLRITATDVPAMRAALNSYLGFIRVTDDMDRLIR